MDYVWHPYIIWDHRFVFIRGAIITAELTIYSVALGLVIGLPLGLMRDSKLSFLRYPSAAIIEFFRSTPTLVQ
ncbi:MAG: ABC transporter permease subunit, partial [Rhodospirillales bacterium]|nr:ABC transporter permease subunit [Rhodospirillales bacterium]